MASRLPPKKNKNPLHRACAPPGGILKISLWQESAPIAGGVAMTFTDDVEPKQEFQLDTFVSHLCTSSAQPPSPLRTLAVSHPPAIRPSTP